MRRLMTVSRAKEEVIRLQEYIDLAESYEVDSMEKLIIKEYAFTNSITEVIKALKSHGFTLNGKEIENKDIVDVLTSKGTDDLHRLIRSGYLLKTRHLRNR